MRPQNLVNKWRLHQKIQYQLTVFPEKNQKRDLTEKISAYINNLTSQIDNSTISNSRHYDLLNKTFEEIYKVKISIAEKVSSDLLAIDIKQAIYYLGELTGEISNDEILGNIFSKFCIGK